MLCKATLLTHAFDAERSEARAPEARATYRRWFAGVRGSEAASRQRAV